MAIINDIDKNDIENYIIDYDFNNLIIKDDIIIHFWTGLNLYQNLDLTQLTNFVNKWGVHSIFLYGVLELKWDQQLKLLILDDGIQLTIINNLIDYYFNFSDHPRDYIIHQVE